MNNQIDKYFSEYAKKKAATIHKNDINVLYIYLF